MGLAGATLTGQQDKHLASQAVRDLAARFEAAGCLSPQLDAEMLVAFVLGTDRSGLWRQTNEPLTASIATQLEELARRREDREPVSYLIGKRWFRRLELTVDERVLIPRPESELLVEWALALPQNASIADIGTGSGAIALAINDERPDLDVVATDIDAGALAVATSNAARLGLDVAFVAGDLLDPLTSTPDAVVSNLPYIPSAQLKDLDPEVSRHEPTIALTPGERGLELVERLISCAAERNVERIALEIGSGQAESVKQLLGQHGWKDVSAVKDLAGIERVVCAAGRPQ